MKMKTEVYDGVSSEVIAKSAEVTAVFEAFVED